MFYFGSLSRTPGHFEIVEVLQIQPKLCVVVEVPRQCRAVSAVIRRRSCTISPMRVAGTCSSRASLFTVRPSGFMKSSRRISPGCTGGISARVFFMSTILR